MTAPVFFIPDLTAEGGVITVSGDEGRHAVTVKRIRVGESVQLGDGQGSYAVGVVSHISGKDTFGVSVPRVEFEPVPQPQVTVIQGLIKGDRMDRAVESLTEVGADEIILWQSHNSIVRWGSDSKSIEKLRRHVREAAKQSRRRWIPDFAGVATTPEVTERIGHSGLAIVLHESAPEELPHIDLAAESITLIIGPEGGISAEELSQLAGAGARAARMGPTVMRAGTAGTVALGWILGAGGRWSKLGGQT